MALQVEVALLANESDPFRPGPIDAGWYHKPYSERRRVRFEAEATDSLATVLKRASAEMNLAPPKNHWSGGVLDTAHRKIAFYKPEDKTGKFTRARGRLLMGELILVDDEGRAIFGIHDLRTVRLQDLIRGAEAGTIEGDPLRPYLILDDGWGDAPPIDWATFKTGLDVAWEVAQALAVATGATTGVIKTRRWILERLRRSREALEANPTWSQRGYRPDQLETLMAIRRWKNDGVAELLGCTEQQAEGVLWALGFELDDETETWEFNPEGTPAFSADLVEAVNRASHAGGDWEIRLQGWISAYVEAEHRPDMAMLDPAPAPPTETAYAPTVGERVDGLLARLRGILARR